MVVIRLTTVRQKYEILSRGQFRFRFESGVLLSIHFACRVRFSFGMVLPSHLFLKPASVYQPPKSKPAFSTVGVVIVSSG